MSEENLPAPSLEGSAGDVPDKDTGFGDVPEEAGKLEEPDIKETDEGLGDFQEAAQKDENKEEDVQGEEEETASIGEQASDEIGEEPREEDEEGLEERKPYDETEGEEEQGGEEAEGGEKAEDEGGEEEGGEQAVKMQSSSASVLIVQAILEEILETVFVAVGEMEPGEELESEEGEGAEEGEGEGEFEGEEFEEEQLPVEKISVMTLKSEASRAASEVSEERPVQGEEQLQKDAEEQSRQETFDRNVRLFNQYIKARGELKRKNAYLTRKMYEFYQQHKMEHLFKEVSSGNQEMEARYLRALMRYDELKNSADIEDGKVTILNELLSTRYEELSTIKEEELATLVTAEKEVGRDLPFNYSSKTLTDKVLDGLIKDQLAKSAEVDDLRVKYFILRDTVNAGESELKALDDIGDGCTMKEYDQLRLHNQGCTEKLEEKDSELEKLRTKALSAMQTFTEIREAVHATSEDIETERRVLTDVERDLEQTRERLGAEKRRRDLNRFDTVRLQRETGLLFRPSLYRDYKRSKIQHEFLENELIRHRERNIRQHQAVTTMRGSIKSLE